MSGSRGTEGEAAVSASSSATGSLSQLHCLNFKDTGAGLDSSCSALLKKAFHGVGGVLPDSLFYKLLV